MRRVLSVTPLVDIFCSVYLLETISSNILHVLVSGETSNLKVGLPRERRKRNNKQENEFGDKNNLETGVK